MKKQKRQNVESKGMYTACVCPYSIKVLIVKKQSYKNKGEKKISFIAIFFKAVLQFYTKPM